MVNTVNRFNLGFLSRLIATCTIGALSSSISLAASQAESSNDHTMSLQQVSTQTEATRIVDNIYSAKGFGNTFLIVTDEGNVVIDSSLASYAPKHKALLNKGKNDHITPPEVAEEFKSLLPQAQLHWIDKCGHAAMMEHPARFNEIVFEWLSKRGL